MERDGQLCGVVEGLSGRTVVWKGGGLGGVVVVVEAVVGESTRRVRQ